MSIRKKTFIYSSFFLIIFTVFTIGITEINLWNGFNAIEDQAIIHAVQRSEIAIGDRARYLRGSLRDWSQWNDDYNYISGNNPDFIIDNVSENQFRSLGLNYMIFLDSNDKVLYSGAFDSGNNKFIDLPNNFVSEVLKVSSKFKLEIISGIINSGGLDPTLIAVGPILKTDGSGPPVGTLIFGRKIDAEVASVASQITTFNFSLFKKSDVADPSFSEDAVKILNDQGVYTEKIGADLAYGYAYSSNEIDGDSDLILRVAVPRDIHERGVSVSLSLVIGLLVVATLALISFILIIDRLILKRIYFLINKVSDVESGKSKVGEIVLSGKDELSILAEKLKNALEEFLKNEEEKFARNEELEQSQKAILNVLEDVEIEKNKTELLLSELQRFKLAVDNASDLIVITDPDAVIIYANKSINKITGYSLKEVIGNKPSLWGGEMSKEFYENLWKTVKEDKVVFIGEVNNRRKNGENYIAELKISPVLDSRGNVIFLVGIQRDITLIKEISDAKTEFVSVASHQLRTPLTGIKWLTEVLLKNRANNLNEKQKETLKEIHLSNDRIINLVNDLLSISRIESGQSKALVLKEVEMVVLLNEVVGALKSVAENRKVNFEIVIDLPKDYKLNIDEEKIRQVMNNLISNAIKYSKTVGGRVDVLVETKNDEFIFSVKDNGIGIPINDQRRLFEKFFRADNAILSETEGTGLGLYIVKSYVEIHGGRIWFESEEDKGSVFHFSLKTN